MAALECTNCGRRQEFPETGITLGDLHRVAREDGYKGKLNKERNAIEALCPDCAPKGP